LIFNRTDSGNTKPLGIISAPKDKIRGIGGPTLDPESGLLFALVNNKGLNRPRKGPDGIDTVNNQDFDQHSDDWFLGVWSIYDRGEVMPRWTIGGGPNNVMKDPKGEVAIDKKRQDVFIAD